MPRKQATTQRAITGSSWTQRFVEALAVLAGGQRPPQEMIDAWFSSDDESLQHWASEHGAFGWHQGIAIIEAAELLADQPAEGEEHAPRMR